MPSNQDSLVRIGVGRMPAVVIVGAAGGLVRRQRRRMCPPRGCGGCGLAVVHGGHGGHGGRVRGRRQARVERRGG